MDVTVVMQATMFVVLLAHNAWIWLISITGVVSLPPYLASTAFLWLYASKSAYPATSSEGRVAAVWTGILGSIYATWLLSAASVKFLLMSPIVFAIGLPVFWYVQKERAPDKPVFTHFELPAAVVLVIVAIGAAVLFAEGRVSIT